MRNMNQKLRQLLIGGMLAFVGSVATAQIDVSGLQEVPRNELPAFGTFVWASETLPPLPFAPDDFDGSFYAFNENTFVMDDNADSPLSLGRGMTSNFELPPDPGGGGESGGGGSPPPNIPNRLKFAGQAFSMIDTNDAAENDTALYNVCLGFPEDTNSLPSLQILRYGANAVIVKANHFDYSSETDRDFALLICDRVETPLWKSVNLNGSSDVQDGWLIQGLVNRYDVVDPMYFLVTNISLVYNGFFRAIPYSGPQIELTGADPYDAVSNSLSLHASISDLTGTTNEHLTVLVNGLDPRYILGTNNTITIDTKYTPNGYNTVQVTADNQSATLYDPTNAPGNAKVTFEGSASLPLDFENPTYLYFQGDQSSPDIGTNFIIFGVTPPVNISATIVEPSSGRTIRTYSGYNPDSPYVELDWDFTDANGTSPFTNDQYVVNFTATAAAPPGGGSPGGGTSMQTTNLIDRSHVRAGGWVISNYEEVKPSSEHGNGGWINSEMAKWGNATEAMYESLYDYDFFSLTQYFSWQIGSGRDNPTSPKMPYILNPSTETNWPTFLQTVLTNRSYSDFNYGPGHGNGYLIGGGEYGPPMTFLNYVNTTVSANQVMAWVQNGASATNASNRYKMRKVTMWACYTARVGQGYGNWAQAFGIVDPAKAVQRMQGKNAGLFFGDDLHFVSYGSPATDVAEVATELDKIWVMGANPYPGGADPNYSIQFAYGVTVGLFPELANAKPFLLGFYYLPYAGVYDDQLMVNDISQVKTH